MSAAWLDAIFANPTSCDNCGRSLDRNGRGAEFRPQTLPPGEMIHGRSFIVLCAYNECLDDGGAP